MRQKPLKTSVLHVLVMFGAILVSGLLATVIIVPDAGRTGECASGYVRDAPDFCRYTQSINTSLSSGVTCQAGTFNAIHPVPATATMVVLQLEHRIKSVNTAGTLHIAQTIFYNEPACSIQSQNQSTRSREFSAVAAGTIIDSDNMIAYVATTGANTFHYDTVNVGGTHDYLGKVNGYYD